MRRLNRNMCLRQSGSVMHQIMLVFVSFFLGYLSASVLSIGNLSQWLNNRILTAQQVEKEQIKAQQEQIPPKRKFEFYTLLTHDKDPKNPNAAHSSNENHTLASTHDLSTQAASTAAAKTVTHSATASHPLQQQAQKVVKATTLKSAPPQAPYIVQVAAFRDRKDAEHMKGSLILKGFNVNVVSVSQPRGIWFRVVVGPYANRDLAQKAQEFLARNERIRGMVTRA